MKAAYIIVKHLAIFDSQLVARGSHEIITTRKYYLQDSVAFG